MATAFHTFAKDVAQLLGATSFQGKSFADEMFYFEKRLAEITPDPLNYSDPVVNLKRYTVGELKSMSNTVSYATNVNALTAQVDDWFTFADILGRLFASFVSTRSY